MLKTYGAAPYAAELKKLEKDIKDKQQTINEKIGVKVRHISLCWKSIIVDPRLGIRYRSRATASMGHRSRQAAHG